MTIDRGNTRTRPFFNFVANAQQHTGSHIVWSFLVTAIIIVGGIQVYANWNDVVGFGEWITGQVTEQAALSSKRPQVEPQPVDL